LYKIRKGAWLKEVLSGPAGFGKRKRKRSNQEHVIREELVQQNLVSQHIVISDGSGSNDEIDDTPSKRRPHKRRITEELAIKTKECELLMEENKKLKQLLGISSNTEVSGSGSFSDSSAAGTPILNFESTCTSNYDDNLTNVLMELDNTCSSYNNRSPDVYGDVSMFLDSEKMDATQILETQAKAIFIGDGFAGLPTHLITEEDYAWQLIFADPVLENVKENIVWNEIPSQ